MMEFVHVAVAVFSLLSVGQSAPLTSCESLIQPLESQGKDQLLGRWTLVAESTDVPSSKALTKMFVDNAWVNITATNENKTINSLQMQKMLGLCFKLSSNLTFENNTLTMVNPYPGSAVLLNTGCPDCLVFDSKHTIGKRTFRALQLLSRRSKVSAAEMDEFKKQIECVNLPSPAILDPEKGFCPDPSVSQETELIDLTDTISNISFDDFSVVEEILRSADGVKLLLKMLSSAIQIKQR